MIIYTWVFGKHFLENEQVDSVTSRKQLTVFADNDKIHIFKKKIEF